jgi:O-Antigen ligase
MNIATYDPTWNESDKAVDPDDIDLIDYLDEPSTADFWGPWFVALAVIVWGAGIVIGFQNALAILVVVGLLAAVYGISKPVMGLFGVTIICTVDALMRTYLMTGGLLRWNTFNYLLLMMTLLAMPIVLKMRDYQGWWLRMFLLLLTCELYMSPSIMSGTNHLMNIVVVISIQVYFLRASDDVNAYLWVGMISGTVAALGGLLYFIKRDGIPHMDENAFAYFPLTGLFGVCLAIRSAIEYRRFVKTLLLLAVVCAGWLLLIGSRGGMLVGSICLLFLVFSIPGQSRKLTIALAIVIAIIGVTSQFEEMRERAFGRVTKMLDSKSDAASRTSGRSDLMLGAWWIFCDHPQGVGTGGFPKHWAIISEERSNLLSGYKRGVEQTCHSGWMKTLAENGIPGVLLMFGYLSSFAFVGWSMRYRGLFLIGLLTSLCLGLAFISTEFAGKGLWFLAAGTTMLLDDRTQIYGEQDL